MGTSPQGVCRRCKTPNNYDYARCVQCNERLPWADAGADQNGEACPACGIFNPYNRAACAQCQAPLPWQDAPAARFAGSHKPERDQQSLLLTVIFTSLVVLVVIVVLFFALWPR